MKRILFLTLIMVCAFTANAQTYLDHLQKNEDGKGHVAVQESQELDALVNGEGNTTTATKPNTSKQDNKKENKKDNKEQQKEKEESTAQHESVQEEQVSEETTTARVGRKVQGYRVQVYAGGNSGADKAKATEIGNAIRNRFPGHTVYVRFVSPRWICRMGNFVSKEEAREMLNEVKAAGYKQACLVQGTITVYE